MQSARVYVTSEHQVEVSGAHASNIAKRGAASVAVLQGGPAPLLAGHTIRGCPTLRDVRRVGARADEFRHVQLLSATSSHGTQPRLLAPTFSTAFHKKNPKSCDEQPLPRSSRKSNLDLCAKYLPTRSAPPIPRVTLSPYSRIFCQQVLAFQYFAHVLPCLGTGSRLDLIS